MLEELNKYLHENLFKECWHESEETKGGIQPCVKCGVRIHFCQYHTKNTGTLYLTDRPNYCENIRNAFRVVDKLREKGFRWEIRQYSNFHVEAIFHKTLSSKLNFAIDKTIELAICQAAKKAIEELKKYENDK